MAAEYPEVLDISPAELRMDLVLNQDNRCFLNLQNTTGDYLLFKVKTTAPKRYAVSPTSGCVGPNALQKIEILMHKMAEVPVEPFNDKFQVQAMTVGDQPIEDAAQITALWQAKEKLHKPKEGKVEYFQKIIKCRVLVPGGADPMRSPEIAGPSNAVLDRVPMSSPAPAPISPAPAPAPAPVSMAAVSPPVSNAGPAPAAENPDVADLVKKASEYDKLVSHAVKLTTENERLTQYGQTMLQKNNELNNMIRSLQQQLADAKTAEDGLRSRRPDAAAKPATAAVATVPESSSSIQLWHVVLIAILCLIVGKML
eukprot:TRINITY_DN551_c0_g1_i11.p1 TRINITY_DN551_c0_g1~~TRINITY_DN551_c0_g1_i11.p1  ORF type:complete len:329 (+),score=156.77 TRINITY_DN551_c0_g1_i11:54-989(+)